MIDDSKLDAMATGIMIGAIAGVVIGGIAAGWAVGVNKDKRWQREAVYYRCAEWTVTDTLAGTTKFQWRGRD